jgi:hypothetical protein
MCMSCFRATASPGRNLVGRRADPNEQPQQGLVGADRAYARPEGGELAAEGLRERECPLVHGLVSCRSTSFSPARAWHWPGRRFGRRACAASSGSACAFPSAGRQHRDSFVGRHGEGLQLDQRVVQAPDQETGGEVVRAGRFGTLRRGCDASTSWTPWPIGGCNRRRAAVVLVLANCGEGCPRLRTTPG